MLDLLWLLVSALFVFLMQAGFVCLESGSTRSKNSINVAAKNILDFIISGAIFWVVGFGIMFGSSYYGLFGLDAFFFGESRSAQDVAFFLFQMMFCGTAATLTSGAVAERMRFVGYMYITVVLSALIYPVAGHWVWASLFDTENKGWLEQLGFVDFAGSTVVHSVGGWMALAAVLIIGPRSGRFSSSTFPVGNNLPVAALGVLLIWFGWFGFNGGSTFAFNEQVPGILLNTCLSAVWGGLTASLLFYWRSRYIDVSFGLNGILAGLVGITAGCHVVTPSEAAIIGCVSGVVVNSGTYLLEKLKIDDPLAVIPTHLFAGIWGTLAVALLGDLTILGTGATRLEQTKIQLFGITIVGLYSFVVSYLLLKLINLFSPLRVSPDEEWQGLNVTEHRATTELLNLLGDMEKHHRESDYTSQVSVEPFTEVGQIAQKYNQVIARVSEEMMQRTRAMEEFKTSEKRKGAILDSSMDSIITIDVVGKILEFNPAAERSFGCLKSHVEGIQFFEQFACEKDQEEFNSSLQTRFSSASRLVLNRRRNIELKRASGQMFPAEITITSADFFSESITEYTLHIRDITREIKLQSRLNFLAYRDPLTHLSNRTHLMKQLSFGVNVCEKTKGSVALFFLDLDNFKKINDTLGHKAGDRLLVEIANRLNQVCREEDTIARLGGDEFIILMTGELSETAIKDRAQRILTTLRQPVIIEDSSHQIAASIGVAVSDQGRVGADELIQQADVAMYDVKVNGRDDFRIFTQELGERASKSLSFDSKIKYALETKQFSLVYQPKVKKGGEIQSLEALIRWRHPELGQVSPSELIGAAEKSNLIIGIGEFVLNEALRQIREWIDIGYDAISVSVNVSGRQLIDKSFIPFVKSALRTHAVPGALLEVEITEGILIDDIELCVQTLDALKALGVTISVDDFGTGYSSLSYLKKLPLDVLKIDRAFVDECDIKSEDAEICTMIINLANSLSLTTVAEGVEKQAQLDTLAGLGCKLFQGYYFSHPRPAKDIEKMLASDVPLVS